MISERQFNIDAPVKSTDPEACTQYIAVDPSQYYYIWCINRPMRTLYETIKIHLMPASCEALDPSFTVKFQGETDSKSAIGKREE